MREAWERSATLIFLDESGFQLTPLMRHTWSPRGHTPIVPAWQRHDRISAISGVTLNVRTGEPGLCFELLPPDLNARADDIVRFLQDVRVEHPGSRVAGGTDRGGVGRLARLCSEVESR